MRSILLLLLLFLFTYHAVVAQDFQQFMADFAKSYQSLHVPALTLSYMEYFEGIPDTAALTRQQVFFSKTKEHLRKYDNLAGKNKLYYEHMLYETNSNLQRISLEKEWIKEGRIIPQNGLYNFPNHHEWYSFFVRKFTSIHISPQEVYALGEKETARVKKEITAIQKKLGFNDGNAFYEHLSNDSFYLHNKKDILQIYRSIDSTVRCHLSAMFAIAVLPPVTPMEWPGADANTPPGIYLGKEYNAYGKDVFQFNFFGQRHNKRAMEWLYMHEAIPGHHLQSIVRQRDVEVPAFQSQFSYPGNFEGWACYVEYYGKDLGLYQDIYSELGKWEWDLVRSVRLVLDVGIHYYGWNREKALQYWKENIHGQDEIAYREITRITNWPCQALSYKAGAYTIEQMKEIALKKKVAAKEFHSTFLHMSYFPLQVIYDNIKS